MRRFAPAAAFSLGFACTAASAAEPTPPPVAIDCPDRTAITSARQRLAGAPELISDRLLAEAMDSLVASGCKTGGRPEIIVVDFALPSGQRRAWVVDVRAGTGQDKAYFVAHGRGSGPSSSGRAARFGNGLYGSGISSLGPFVGGALVGAGHYRSAVRLYGLGGKLNNQAYDRRIYLHTLPDDAKLQYVSDDFISKNKRAGRSCGCFVVQKAAFYDTLQHLMKNGGFLYAGYSQDLPAEDRTFEGPAIKDCGDAALTHSH